MKRIRDLRETGLAIFLIIALIGSILIPLLSETSPPKTTLAFSTNVESAKCFLSDTNAFLAFDPLTLLDQLSLNPGLEEAWKEFLKKLKEELEIDFEQDIRPWLGDEMAFGFVLRPDAEVKLPFGLPEAIPSFPFLQRFLSTLKNSPCTIVIKTTDPDAAQDFFMDKYVKKREERGDTYRIEIYSYWPPIGIAVINEEEFYTVIGDWILIGLNGVDLDRFKSNMDLIYKDTGTPLWDNADFQQALNKLPSERTGMGYFDMDYFLDEVLSPQLKSPDEKGALATLRPYAPPFIAFSFTGVDEEGFAGLRFHAPAPQGFDFLAEKTNPLESASFVPQDALYFASGLNLNAYWQELLRVARENSEEEWATRLLDSIAAFEDKYGLDLDEDLFGWMRDEFALAILPERLRPSERLPLAELWRDLAGQRDVLSRLMALLDFLGRPLPEVRPEVEEDLPISPFDLRKLPLLGEALKGAPAELAIFKVEDEALVEQKLQNIFAAARNAGRELAIEPSGIEGVPAFFLISDDFARRGLKPGYFLLDGFLVIGSSERALNAAIRAYLNPALSLAQDPEYQWIVSHLPEDKALLTYLNLTRAVDFLLTGIGPVGEEGYFEYLEPFLVTLKAIGACAFVGAEDTDAALALHVEKDFEINRIRGRVILEGRRRQGGATVVLGGQGTATDKYGFFSFTDLQPGGELRASMPGYLEAVKEVEIGEGIIWLGEVKLLGGDADENGVIDYRDLVEIAKAFGPAGSLPDIDASGMVDIYDLVLAGKNYGWEAPTSWRFDRSRGSICGFVYEEDGTTPIRGALILALDPETEEVYTGAFSRKDGSYAIRRLPPGDYLVRAMAWPYLGEYYSDATSPEEGTQVTVLADADTSGVNFTLPEGGRISGTVLDPEGKPLTGIPVVARSMDGGERDGWKGGATLTSWDGSYTIEGLPSGDYLVRALGSAQGYIDEYYGDAIFESDAAPVPVIAPGETAGIDFRLAEGGRISGTVLDTAGKAAAGASVVALLRNPEGGWEPRGAAMVTEEGDYLITGLPSGNYLVRVLASPLGYIDEYYDDALFRDEATQVTVNAPDETAGINFTLAPGGSISGRVLDSTGRGAIGALVEARLIRDGRTETRGCGVVLGGMLDFLALPPLELELPGVLKDILENLFAEEGSYRIEGLPSGEYLVRTHASWLGLQDEFYDDVPTADEATPVSVTAPQETTGIDFILEEIEGS